MFPVLCQCIPVYPSLIAEHSRSFPILLPINGGFSAEFLAGKYFLPVLSRFFPVYFRSDADCSRPTPGLVQVYSRLMTLYTNLNRPIRVEHGAHPILLPARAFH